MDKKDLTEQEICTRCITSAIQDAGWLPRQIHEEVCITDGQIHLLRTIAPRGSRIISERFPNDGTIGEPHATT